MKKALIAAAAALSAAAWVAAPPAYAQRGEHARDRQADGGDRNRGDRGDRGDRGNRGDQGNRGRGDNGGQRPTPPQAAPQAPQNPGLLGGNDGRGRGQWDGGRGRGNDGGDGRGRGQWNGGRGDNNGGQTAGGRGRGNDGGDDGDDEDPDETAGGSPDVDGNGVVELQDARLVMRFIMGWRDVVEQPVTLDATGDGRVNTDDVVEIRPVISGGAEVRRR